jgi:hypothetical protein
MNNEIKVHTETYMVVDDHGVARWFSSVLSAKIEDKRLILLSSHGNVIASFSSWGSSCICPELNNMEKTNENL